MATKAIIRCKKCGEEFPIYWNDVTHEPIKCKHSKRPLLLHFLNLQLLRLAILI